MCVWGGGLWPLLLRRHIRASERFKDGRILGDRIRGLALVRKRQTCSRKEERTKPCMPAPHRVTQKCRPNSVLRLTELHRSVGLTLCCVSQSYTEV